jgi:hypothetical protein
VVVLNVAKNVTYGFAGTADTCCRLSLSTRLNALCAVKNSHSRNNGKIFINDKTEKSLGDQAWLMMMHMWVLARG